MSDHEMMTAAEYIEATGCLRRFRDGQRVEVIDTTHPLHGKQGVVVRVCIGGLQPWNQSPDGMFWNVPEAWVRMDDPLPSHLRSFPASDSRGQNVRFDASQCGDAEKLERNRRRPSPSTVSPTPATDND